MHETFPFPEPTSLTHTHLPWKHGCPLVSVGYWFQDPDTEVHGFSCPFYKRRQSAPYLWTPHTPLDLLSGWLNTRMCLEDVELLLLLLLFSCSPVWLFETRWTIACQAPRSMGFPRQEHWSGLSFPSPGDLPKPEINASPALADGFFTIEGLGKPYDCILSPEGDSLVSVFTVRT